MINYSNKFIDSNFAQYILQGNKETHILQLHDKIVAFNKESRLVTKEVDKKNKKMIKPLIFHF